MGKAIDVLAGEVLKLEPIVQCDACHLVCFLAGQFHLLPQKARLQNDLQHPLVHGQISRSVTAILSQLVSPILRPSFIRKKNCQSFDHALPKLMVVLGRLSIMTGSFLQQPGSCSCINRTSLEFVIC